MDQEMHLDGLPYANIQYINIQFSSSSTMSLTFVVQSEITMQSGTEINAT